jgi:hypothetical protein
MKPLNQSDLGIFKCLGCEHYLSGDNFNCETFCPRIENGVTQVNCRVKYLKQEISTLEKEIRQKRKLLFACRKLVDSYISQVIH